MDLNSYHRTIKLADRVDTECFQVSAGVIMATKVTLDRIESADIDDSQLVEWVVINQAANPPRVVLHTTDPVAAHRAYADQVEAAQQDASERTMWRR